MKIAIHSSELNEKRIDGTRVYISRLLNYFQQLNSEDEFLIYHKGNFNPELKPPKAKNYTFKPLKSTPFWTQVKFAWEVFKDNPDILWMPIHDLPFFRRSKMKKIVTAHDLAFKFFPETFPKKDLRKLNFLANYSFQKADKIIAISQATKNDLLQFYPKIKEEDIKVIHHGFDSKFWQESLNEIEVEQILKKYNLTEKKYLIYVGTIQPRKNLSFLIKVFEQVKKNYPDLKLVLAGGKGWLWEATFQTMQKSAFSQDVIFTDTIPFKIMRILLRQAKIFVFPSLYEGFGIPLLEAMASKVPVVCARNSSLIEVGGEAVSFFETTDLEDCQNKIEQILGNSVLQEEMIEKGLRQVQNFSWKKCAEETLDFLRK